MNDELKAKLERYAPVYVAVQIDNGVVKGRVEHSFSLDWDAKNVRVWWSGKAYSILGEHQLSGEADAKHNINQFDHRQFIFNALSEDCPIEVDWERWIASLEKQPGDKFAKRNAPFRVKAHGEWQLRALSAEVELNKLKPVHANIIKQRDEAEEKLEKLNNIINPQEENNED